MATLPAARWNSRAENGEGRDRLNPALLPEYRLSLGSTIPLTEGFFHECYRPRDI